MKTTGQHIWRKIKKGDIKAFETLYKSFYSPLCLYAVGFITDEEKVKEIVNDVFFKIWQKRENVDIKHGLKAYLYRCVHNAGIDYLTLKRTQEQNRMTGISDKIKEIAGQDEENILEKIAFSDVEKDVMRSINNLPPQCREIFLLSRFELLTYNEISEKLNISVNTVKTQISRALDSLRVSLKKYL